MTGASRSRPLARLLTPHFGVLVFVLHVLVVLQHPNEAVMDPGVGWHLRTGHLILDSQAVPRTDPFSYTAEGRPWVNYYWGFQVVSAALERAGGLPLVATIWMLVYACVPFVLYRGSIQAGANPLVALLVLPIADTVLLSHALARPHVITYLCFALLAGGLAQVESGRRPIRALWWAPPMMALWANLHGGFVAGLGAVALVALAQALGAATDGADAAWRRARPFVLLGVAMGVASLANPYGWAVHLQAVAHVGHASTARFAEFRSPDFRDGGSAVECFELLLLTTLLLVATRRVRLRLGSLALLLATLHMALRSARDMNLFVLVATPLVAVGLTRLFAAGWPRLHARWTAIAGQQETAPAWAAQLAAASTLFVALAWSGRLPFPTSLDGLQLSRGGAQFLEAHAERFARSFNTDGLGGTLIYRFWPRLHVFVDDRTPVYGEPFMAKYFHVFDARPGWEDVLDRWRVTGAIVATGTPVASALRASPRWTVEYADEQTLVCSRDDAS